jgi:hypothetical protein
LEKLERGGGYGFRNEFVDDIAESEGVEIMGGFYLFLFRDKSEEGGIEC